MANARAAARRLLLEQLSERIAFHVGEMHEDDALLFTPTGQAYYHDEPPNLAVLANEVSELELAMERSGIGPKVGPIQPPIAPALLTVPVYHSNPSFPMKIYLDFDGHVAENTYWNNNNFGGYATGSTITAPAFSLDTDLDVLSPEEQALIPDVWARVAEDYAPFSSRRHDRRATCRAVHAGRASDTRGHHDHCRCCHWARMVSSGWRCRISGFVELYQWLALLGICELSSRIRKVRCGSGTHEVGHTLNLYHDGRTPSEGYYRGHGSGSTSWAPIMGVGYYINVSQWSQGEYTAADNTEDDLAIIASKLPYINDDHGDTTAAATQLNVGTASSLATNGLITTRTDVDAFRFPTQAGTIMLRVDPFDYATNQSQFGRQDNVAR